MPRRLDSLLLRLLLMQALLALAMVALFAAFFYAERNITVARLLADRWAPALQLALGRPLPEGAVPSVVLQRAESMPDAVPVPTVGPRLAALQDSLGTHGIQVEQAAISLGGQAPVLWLRVAEAGAKPWFGLPGNDLLPSLPSRLLGALLVGLLAVVSASVLFTRRLTRPLRLLEAAMQAQGPGREVQEPPPPGIPASAPPELRAIDAAWNDLRQRYRQHETERAVLLAGVSHDLRSPLARIRLAVDLLPSSMADRRDSIVRNVQVADRLIESFLDHVRAGELPLNECCDLAALARRVASRCADQPPGPVVEAPVELWCGRVNALLLERLMTNLLDNARKHGAPPVRMRLHALDQTIRVEVADGGPGIPSSQWQAALQAFTRGDASRSASGTGLGLAIVERIARRLGGVVVFEHGPGSFVAAVEFPRHPAASSPPGTAATNRSHA